MKNPQLEKLRKATLSVSQLGLAAQVILRLIELPTVLDQDGAFVIGYLFGSALVIAPMILAIMFTSKVIKK